MVKKALSVVGGSAVGVAAIVAAAGTSAIDMMTARLAIGAFVVTLVAALVMAALYALRE